MSDLFESNEYISQLDVDFEKATKHVQGAYDKYSSTDLLKLYALYKQSVEGPCQCSKPSFFNKKDRAKWCAWYDLGSMPQAEAKRQYITELTNIDAKWRETTQEDISSHTQSWVVHSVQLPPEEEPIIPEHKKTCFDYVKEGNLIRLRELLKEEELQKLDECGLGLVHWATDRNLVEILEFLLQNKTNVDLQDAEGQTALHYAAACGNIDCLKLLLKYGADKNLRDLSGQTCLEVTDDEEIQRLLEN